MNDLDLVPPALPLSSASGSHESTKVQLSGEALRFCVCCGVTFKPIRSNSRYCSRQCIWTHRNNKKKKPLLILDCKTCGQCFTQTNPTQLFCCHSCAQKASNRREHNKERKKKCMQAYLKTERGMAMRAKSRRKEHDSLRTKLCEALGNKCAKCGFDNPLALEIHHPNGDGKSHRKEFKNVKQYYADCKTSGRVILICANCHEIEHRLSKTRGGVRKYKDH